MRLVNKIQKNIIVIVASLMLFSSVSVFAQGDRFKDVPKKHWAYSVIENVAELGYMKGVSSDKFSPNSTLTFDEAIVLLGRFTNPTSEDRKMANSIHGEFLRGLNVRDWVREDMAVAMYKDIISMDQIQKVYDEKLGDKPISKLGTSMYLVKSMGLTEEANNKSMFSLTYTDVFSMSTIEMKYLAVLIEAGVLDPKGSGSGLFEPKSSLRRDIMAKMLSTAYDYLEKNPDKAKNPSKPSDNADTEKIEKISGVIVSPLSKSGNENFVIIDDGRGKQDGYKILNDTSVTLDGNTTTYLDLAEGQEVDLIVRKELREIVSINAFSMDQDFTGIIKNISASTSKIIIERIVDKKTTSLAYTVDKNSYITLNGEKSKLESLKVGDSVKVKMKNGLIYDIEAESKRQEVKGIIQDLRIVEETKDSKYKEYNITILDSKDKLHKFLINTDTILYKENKKTYEATDLKIRDEAEIIAEYGVALDIEAKVVRTRVQGIIAGMNTRLHQKLELTILNKESKKEETYVVGQAPFIRIDDKVTNTFDLKVGYYVDLLIEGDEIIELDGDSTAAEVSIMGTVSYINPSNLEMAINVDSFDLNLGQYGDEITIYVKKDAVISRIENRVIKPIALSYIVKGDRIHVIGSYDGNSLIADTIQLR